LTQCLFIKEYFSVFFAQIAAIRFELRRFFTFSLVFSVDML